jgi:hypothetical protein
MDQWMGHVGMGHVGMLHDKALFDMFLNVIEVNSSTGFIHPKLILHQSGMISRITLAKTGDFEDSPSQALEF